MTMITVCKNCEDREIGCHSTCERYLQQKEETKNIKTVIHLKKKQEIDQYERVVGAIKNWNRHRKK